jgi:hypothetical protein
MAKFTSKKKAHAIAGALRNIHILTRAIKMEAQIVKENLDTIEHPEDVRAFKEMLNKCNFFTSRMDNLYRTDDKSIRFLTETKGESAIDELSLRVLDSVNDIVQTFTHHSIKPN